MKLSKRVLCVLLALSLACLASCGKSEEETTTEETTEYIYDYSDSDLSSEVSSDASSDAVTDAPVTETQTEAPTAAPTEAATAAPTANATEAATQKQSTNASTDYSSYTKAQILNTLKTAVNKTKAYTGDITVHHKESFTDFNVSNVSPGGALAEQAFSFIKGLVIKPSEEDYKFSGGTATTSEGESTQLLLPKDAQFTLAEEGVKSATIERKNNLTHIVLTLNSEQVTSLSEKPKYNSSAIGYLDLNGSFSKMKITSITIKYPGSVIEAYIRDDGYVSSAIYTINLDCHGEASFGVLSGKADFGGAQTEVWTVKWQ